MSPKTYCLFKYRSVSDDVARSRTRGIIAERHIYYAAPNQFNDPFDCHVCLDMDGADLSAMRLPKARESEVKAYSERWLRNETSKHYAVLSLSEINDSVLMWSHYSDCHRGICLEFHFEATEPLYEVKYRSERPVLYFADSDEAQRDEERFHQTVMDTLTIKAADWAYEKEWRCIDTSGPGERPIPTDMLTGIIFGCRTPDGDKAVVRDWVRSSGQNVAFYQATQRDCAFALDIQPTE